MKSLLGTLAITVAVFASASNPGFGYDEDFPFFSVPTRQLSNDTNHYVLGRSAYKQGGRHGAIRSNTNYKATGWFVEYSGTLFDEEIVRGVAHRGVQCLRIGNYYNTGIINAMASPWLAAPAGETGSRDQGAAGLAATSSNIYFSFWFRSVTNSTPGTNQNTFMSFAPDDGAGARWGGSMVLRDDAGGVRLYWANANHRDPGGGGPIYSPFLQYAAWYQVRLDITFVDGNRRTDTNFFGNPNDIVVLNIYDAAHSNVFHADQYTTYLNDAGTISTGLTTWEDADWYSTNYAVNSMQVRMSRPGSLGDYTDTFASPRPAGFYIDDFDMGTGAGLEYFTSFEVLPPQTIISIR